MAESQLVRSSLQIPNVPSLDTQKVPKARELARVEAKSLDIRRANDEHKKRGLG